jgi:hypothetical protein
MVRRSGRDRFPARSDPLPERSAIRWHSTAAPVEAIDGARRAMAPHRRESARDYFGFAEISPCSEQIRLEF